MNNRYTLTIDAGADPLHRAPEIRLRQWLKIGLRAFRLKVVTIEPPKTPHQTSESNVAMEG